MKVFDKANQENIQSDIKRIEDVERLPDMEQIAFAVKSTLADVFSSEQLKFYGFFILTTILGGFGVHRILSKKIGSGITMLLFLIIGLILSYTQLTGFAGILVDIGAYLFLGLWALWLIIDLFSLFSEDNGLIERSTATNFHSAVFLISATLLFYQWVYVNHTELPIISSTVNQIERLLEQTLPNETAPADSVGIEETGISEEN